MACSSPDSAEEPAGLDEVDLPGKDAGPSPRALPPPLCSVLVDCGGQPILDEPKTVCTMTIGDGLGAQVYQGRADIETRGRSSLSFPKKQFGVELMTDEGDEYSVDLFGMGKESDWILNGMYIDRSLMRNKLVFDLFQALGGKEHYAPETRHCELTVDGDWRGIYLLTERIKRDGARVDIGSSPDGGSFILKTDDREGTLENPIGFAQWQMVYPKPDGATPQQLAGIRAWLRAWAAAARGETGSEDLFTLVNLESAVDFVLLQEFLKNVDAFYLSVHVWKDAGGQLHFLPWDFDLSFGQPSYQQGSQTTGWVVRRPRMIQAMAEDPRFQARLVSRWKELRATVFTSKRLQERMAWMNTTIAPRVADNFARWPLEDIEFLGSSRYLYPVASHEDELQKMTAWMAARLAWMDGQIANYADGN